MKRFALLISNILSPFLLIPTILTLVSLNYSNTLNQFFMTLFILIFAGIFPVLAIFGLFMKLGWISDWGINKRSERYIINSISLVFAALLLILIRQVAASSVIYFLTFFFNVFLIFTIITFFTKISAHTSSITLFILTLSVLYGKEFLLSMPLIPLVIWSRIFLNRHTLFQAVSGVLVTAIIFSVFYRIF